MTEIDVTAWPTAGGWRCEVELRDASGGSRHEVTVSRDDLARLDPDASSPEALVRRSFAFLLEREPRESILRAFELPLIGRYFPEYSSVIVRR